MLDGEEFCKRPEAGLNDLYCEIRDEILDSTKLSIHELKRVQAWVMSNQDKLDTYSVSYLNNALKTIDSELCSLRELAIEEVENGAKEESNGTSEED